jgi:hypothetical protein
MPHATRPQPELPQRRQATQEAHPRSPTCGPKREGSFVVPVIPPASLHTHTHMGAKDTSGRKELEDTGEAPLGAPWTLRRSWHTEHGAAAARAVNQADPQGNSLRSTNSRRARSGRGAQRKGGAGCVAFALPSSRLLSLCCCGERWVNLYWRP